MIENKTKLAEAEVDKELKSLEGWKRDGIFLKKDFIFTTFKEINKFLPHLTSTIVEQNHHPDFSFNCDEKRVSIKVTTHSEGGLTQSDLNLAITLNQWKGA